MPSQGPENALADVIEGLNSQRFPERLDRWLRHFLPFDNNIMLAFRGDAPPLVLYKSYSSPVVYAAFHEYLEAAYLLDPFFQAHLAHVPAGIHRLSDLAPPNFRRGAYYRSYYRQTTLIDEIAAVAYTAGGFTINVCLGKDWTSNRPFTRRDIAALKEREKIVCALLRRHWANLDVPAKTAGKPPPEKIGEGGLAAELAAALRRDRGVVLTPRQAEIALLILRGHSSASIALHLGISPQTVKVHRKQLYARCRIGSQVELFAMLVPLMADLSGKAFK